MRKVAWTFSILTIIMLISGCDLLKSNQEKISDGVKTSMQNTFDTDPTWQEYKMLVTGVVLLEKDSKTYMGIANVIYNGVEHNVAIDVWESGEGIMWEAPAGSFIFLAQQELLNSEIVLDNNVPSSNVTDARICVLQEFTMLDTDTGRETFSLHLEDPRVLAASDVLDFFSIKFLPVQDMMRSDISKPASVGLHSYYRYGNYSGVRSKFLPQGIKARYSDPAEFFVPIEDGTFDLSGSIKAVLTNNGKSNRYELSYKAICQ